MDIPFGGPAATHDAALDILSAPALDAAFARPARLGVASAWYGHVPFAHWLVDAVRPGLIVELGTHNGVSYSAFCEAAARGGGYARCNAVDTWQGDEHAGFYGDAVLDELRAFHDVRYGAFSELMRCTFDEALAFFADGSIDLLHLDGLHTYEAVRHDWETWRPKLSPRAVVLFHDINEHQGSFGVWQLWEELRAAHPAFTFLHAHGLGVLAPGGQPPDAVAALCALPPAAAGRVRERFAQLGARWDIHSEFVQTLALRQAAEAQNAALAGQLAAMPSVGELAATRARLAEYEAAGRRAVAEIAAYRTQKTALAEALEQARGSLAEARDEGSRAAAAAETALEASDGLRVRLDDAHGYQGTLERRVAEQEAELGRLHGELARRADDWERVHVVLAARDAALAQAQAVADRIQQSTSWRVAAPLRAVGRSVPGLAGGARRATRAGRMAITGDLGRRRELRRARAAEVTALRASPLFDAAYYLREHPELAAAGHDPAAHYAWVGARSGAKPNPYFDSAWYLAQNPGVAGNPLLHWQEKGAAAGLNPNPFLAARWYRERYPDAGADALLHYLQVGAAENRDPNAMMDAEAYLLEYPAARAYGMGALLHWWHHGAGAGYNPHPLFDAAWYCRRYGLPAGADPLAHWLEHGQNQPASPIVERTGGLRPIQFTASAHPAVSVVVPVYGHYADTVRCLYALFAGTDAAQRWEVLVVDDCPANRTVPLLARRIPGLRVMQNPSNLGFLRSCNNAARGAGGDLIVFLNNDTAVHPGWLPPILDLLERDRKTGLVGCKLIGPDGTLQEAGGAIGSDGWGIPYGAGDDPARPEYNFVREVDVAIGACIAVRRAAWEAVGGFDERYVPAFYEEFDLAFAVRDRGWRVMYQPASVIDHLGSHSYGAEARDRHTTVSHAKFCAKWAAALRTRPKPNAAPFLLRERLPPAGTLLFIDDQVPQWDRHAGALSGRHYMTLWQKLGYKVVFFPAADTRPVQPYTARLQQEGVEILHAPETLAAWLARNGRFVSLIWTARPDVTAPILSLLRDRCDAPILYFTHDLHYVREQRRYALDGDPRALAESRRYKAMEHAIFARVDRVLSVSSEESRFIQAEVPGSDVHTLPAYTFPMPRPAPDEVDFARRDTLLFVGGYGHPPNVDAALFLIRDIMPIVWQSEPGLHVVLAGSRPTAEVEALAGPNVAVPGFREDLGPLYDQARMSVSPLRYGAGLKGKIVAALWEGVPVVTTSIGNEGLGLVSGEQALVADDAAAFAAAILELWRDPARCASLASQGRAVAAARFTPEVAMPLLRHLAEAGRNGAIRPAGPRAAARAGERI